MVTVRSTINLNHLNLITPKAIFAYLTYIYLLYLPYISYLYINIPKKDTIPPTLF
jgi:hypothetical protein